ncbi:MAG: hypothetical protein ACRC0J_10730, partial [Shewanella oncorhynchi]
VQDYRDLGLVLADGDKLSSAVEDGWVYKKSESHLPLKYHGVVSFAWRNNDGVKTEYKGLIHAMFENGAIIQDVADSLNWGSSFNPILQWRPVVLQSVSPTVSPKEDKLMKPSEVDQSCREPKAIFNTESTIFSDRLRKAMGDFESGDLDMSIITGKLMKPVYTAEMHEKGKLPPVGVECSLKSGSLTQWFNGVCVGYDEEFAVFKMCDDYPFGGRYAGFCLDRIKPIIKTIKVNGFDVPAPMSEAPECSSEYFVIDILSYSLFSSIEWEGDDKDNQWLSKGIIHSTKSAAIAHAKAILGIDPNA